MGGRRSEEVLGGGVGVGCGFGGALVGWLTLCLAAVGREGFRAAVSVLVVAWLSQCVDGAMFGCGRAGMFARSAVTALVVAGGI